MAESSSVTEPRCSTTSKVVRPLCMQRAVFALLALSLSFGCRDSPKASPPAPATAPSGSAPAPAPANSEPAAERYRVRGKIVSLAAEELELHHERIPAIRGYDGTVKPMESMTMPFGRNQMSFANLAVGDAIEIQFTVHFDAEPTLRLVEIVKLPAGTKLEL